MTMPSECLEQKILEWSKILKKEDVLVYQSSERGGLMRVKRDLRGIDVNGRVKLVKHFNQEI